MGRCIVFRGGCKIRKDIPALPFSRAEQKVHKPLGNKYIDNPTTVGEHIRNRRLELGLLQKDIAEIFKVSIDSVTYWEVGRTGPSIEQMPKVIEFLGYLPFEIDKNTAGGKVKYYRYVYGLSQEKFAKLIGIDTSTVARIEANRHSSKSAALKKILAYLTKENS